MSYMHHGLLAATPSRNTQVHPSGLLGSARFFIRPPGAHLRETLHVSDPSPPAHLNFLGDRCLVVLMCMQLNVRDSILP